METRRRYLARNAHAVPRQQKGAVYAPAVAAVPWLFLAVVLLLGWAVLAITLAFARHTRGAVRWLGVIALTALWLAPLWSKIDQLNTEKASEDAKKARWMGAKAECEKELPGLPAAVPAQGLLDEGRGVLMDGWRHLLGREDLGFLEVHVHAGERQGNAGLLIYADGSGSAVWWDLKQKPGALVKIALSHDVRRHEKLTPWRH